MSDFPRPQLTPQQRAARTHRALCFDFSAVSSADAAHLAQAMADALDAATATGAAALPPRLKLIEQVVAVASQSRSRVATGHQQLLAVIVVRLPLAVLRACAEHMVASSRTAMHHTEADGDASASPVPPRVVALLGPLIGDLRAVESLYRPPTPPPAPEDDPAASDSEHSGCATDIDGSAQDGGDDDEKDGGYATDDSDAAERAWILAELQREARDAKRDDEAPIRLAHSGSGRGCGSSSTGGSSASHASASDSVVDASPPDVTWRDVATALDFLASMLASDLLFGNPTATPPPTTAAAATHSASPLVDASSASSVSAPSSGASSLQSSHPQSQSAVGTGPPTKNATAAKTGDAANTANVVGGVRQRHAIFGSQTAPAPAMTASDKPVDKASAGGPSSQGPHASASAFSSAASASAFAFSLAAAATAATVSSPAVAAAAASESHPPLSAAFTAAWGDAAFDSTVAALLLEQIATLADTDATHRALAAVRIGAAAEVGRHWDWDASAFAESGSKANEADGGDGGSNAAANGSNDAAKGVDSILDFDANESDEDRESNQSAHSSAAQAGDSLSDSVPHPLVAAAPGFLASLRQRVGYMFRDRMLTHPTTVPTLLPIYLRRLLALSPVAAALVPDKVQSRIRHDAEIEALLLASQIWSSVSPHAGRLTDIFTHILHSPSSTFSSSSHSLSASTAADTVALQIAAAASVLSSAGNAHTSSGSAAAAASSSASALVQSIHDSVFDLVLPLLAGCVLRLARGLATFAVASPTARQLSEVVCLCHVVAMTTLHATAAEALRIDESNVFPQLIACCASVQHHFKKLGGAAPAAALRAAFVASKLWRVCLLIAAARPEFRALRSNVMASVAMQRLLAEGDSGAQDASAKTAPVEENDAIDRSRPALAASPLSMPLSERALWALALESSAACAAADSSLATIGMFEAVFGAADSAAVSTHLASAVGFSEDALFCANLLLLSAPFRKESTAVRGASVAALSPTFSASLATPPIDTVSALHRILRAALQRANAALSELSLAQTAAAAAAASVGINSSRNDADDDENDKRTRPPTQGIKISSELRSRIAAAVAESPSSPSPPTAAAAAAAAAAPASSSSTRPIPIHAHESASESTSKAAEVRLARTKRVRAALKQLVYDWSASANSNASSQAARKSD